MNNVRKISADLVTPEDVLNGVAEQLADIKALYVVTIDKSGQATCFASGTLNDMAYAALAFNAQATDYILGRND